MPLEYGSHSLDLLFKDRPPKKKEIRSYSFKPRRWIPRYTRDSTPPLLGVELELDRKPEAPVQLDEREVAGQFEPERFWIAKTDGSVDGPELVSHPATYSWWMEHAADIEHALFIASEAGWRSHDGGRAGLHIGIGRYWRSNVWLDFNACFRLNALVYGNPEAMRILSRRWIESVNSWAQLHSNCFPWERPYTRYVALNYHRRYIEFRLPRGTLNPTTFFASLEWAASMARWAQASTIRVNAPNIACGPGLWDSWMEFLDNHRNEYRYLPRYIQDRLGSFPIESCDLPEPSGVYD